MKFFGRPPKQTAVRRAMMPTLVGQLAEECGLVALAVGRPDKRPTAYADEEAGARTEGLLGCLDGKLLHGLIRQGKEGVVGEHICTVPELREGKMNILFPTRYMTGRIDTDSAVPGLL